MFNLLSSIESRVILLSTFSIFISFLLITQETHCFVILSHLNNFDLKILIKFEILESIIDCFIHNFSSFHKAFMIFGILLIH
jgi:hypothetical protein